MSSEKIVRHSVAVRWTHWIVAISGILLLFSGFGQMPMYPRYNVIKIPGLWWSGNYEITLLLHYIFAALFTGAVAFHIIYHLRRGEFAIVPRKGDIRESITSIKAMFGRAQDPLHDKFQAKQRLAYGVIGVSSLLLIVTGLVKSWKNLGNIVLDPFSLQTMTTIHTIVGMFFLLLFFAHIGALLLYRPLIASMFYRQAQ